MVLNSGLPPRGREEEIRSTKARDARLGKTPSDFVFHSNSEADPAEDRLVRKSGRLALASDTALPQRTSGPLAPESLSGLFCERRDAKLRQHPRTPDQAQSSACSGPRPGRVAPTIRRAYLLRFAVTLIY